LKTIVLIDDATGGHRDAFMRLFSKACLEIGVKVICIYPDISIIKTWMEQHAPTSSDKIIYIENNFLISKLKNGIFSHPLSMVKEWKNRSAFLKKLEKKLALKIDLVFFNWMDSQLANNIPPLIIDTVFPYKWSGLYFHPTIFRMEPNYLQKKLSFRDIDSVFLAKNCKAITFHDEGLTDRYQTRIKKQVILFPEIADITSPNTQQSLAKTIKEKAKGRIVIGTIGLEKHKGCLSIIRLCKHADASKFFFAFTGIFTDQLLSNFNTAERKEIHSFKNNLPENAIWQTGALQEGEEYNSVFCSFDIIYIIYNNFFSSSNRLTKAAYFKKLVLANNYGCVGDDVPKYQLGETADEFNMDEQVQKIESLRTKILNNDFPFEQWKTYSEKHSTERLKEKFEELLNLV